MSFFPSDWDDEEDDQFNGNVEELVKEFEGQAREDFSPRELLEIFRYYSMGQLFSSKDDAGKTHMKMVLELGINQFPYIPVFAIHMVEILMAEKNYRLSRKYIAQAKEYNAFEPALFFMEAVVLSLEGRKEKSLEQMNTGLELAADDEETLEDFLELLLYYSRFEMALPVLERALQRNQDVSYILEKWLDLSTNKDQIDQIIPLLEKMVDDAPYSEDAWYLLGSAWLELENHERSAWAFDFAITINDNFQEAWLGYLESIYELGQYTDFIRHHSEQVKRFNPAVFEELEGLLAWSYHETGDTAQARTLYRKILKANPQDGESWYSMGLTYHYEQNFSAAVPYLERAYELNPAEPDYGIVLAAAYFGINEKEKWEAMYDMLSQEHPEEEEVYLDWGIALHETGDTDKAMDITQSGLKQNPNSFRLMYRLAAICYITGQHAAAEYLLETALTVNVEEHTQMFTFAPELKKASSLLRIIARFVNPGI